MLNGHGFCRLREAAIEELPRILPAGWKFSSPHAAFQHPLMVALSLGWTRKQERFHGSAKVLKFILQNRGGRALLGHRIQLSSSQASISSHLLTSLIQSASCEMSSSTCILITFLQHPPSSSQDSPPVSRCSDTETLSCCHQKVPVVGWPSPESSFVVECRQAGSVEARLGWRAGLCLC